VISGGFEERLGMKRIIGTIALSAALLVQGTRLTAQNAQDLENQAQANENAALLRSLAASKTKPVSAEQCAADLSRWAAEQKRDNHWYINFSTEDLMTLAEESNGCAAISVGKDSQSLVAYLALSDAFEQTLRLRAERVLIGHRLFKEYMLASSQ
jgi:type II secretory pathway pseudopilin PulG